MKKKNTKIFPSIPKLHWITITCLTSRSEVNIWNICNICWFHQKERFIFSVFYKIIGVRLIQNYFKRKSEKNLSGIKISQLTLTSIFYVCYKDKNRTYKNYNTPKTQNYDIKPDNSQILLMQSHEEVNMVFHSFIKNKKEKKPKDM